MPVFSHEESDRASFRDVHQPLVINGNCTQAQIVRAFGISAISMKRYVNAIPGERNGGVFSKGARRASRGC